MSDDPVDDPDRRASDAGGARLDLHFQEYWVRRGGADEVKAVRYEGAEARAARAGRAGGDRAAPTPS